MNALTIINGAGVDASLYETSGLKLRGLSKLDPEKRTRIINFAVHNKAVIMAELSMHALPTDCPLITGAHCPQGCRFETKLLVRMIREAMMPTDRWCPLIGVCGLKNKGIKDLKGNSTHLSAEPKHRRISNEYCWANSSGGQRKIKKRFSRI